jgi:hypothetical protein
MDASFKKFLDDASAEYEVIHDTCLGLVGEDKESVILMLQAAESLCKKCREHLDDNI